MKIRIHEQHLRFRLAESEVVELLKSGFFSENIAIGGSILGFSIYLVENPTHPLNSSGQKEVTGSPSVQLVGSHTRLEIPRMWTAGWQTNDVVGFEFEIPPSAQPKSDRLTVIIEKDYPCAHTKEGKALFGTPVKMKTGLPWAEDRDLE